MAEYDGFSESYAASKLLPFRTCEQLAFLKKVGDAKGLRVLDLACGSGFYSRLAKTQANAAKVVGVDISSDMIQLAREAEAKEPLGNTYFVADVTTLTLKDLGEVEPFDLVMCTFLFNYSENEEQLRTMFQAVRNLIKPQGRVVALTENAFQEPDSLGLTTSFGFVKEALSDQQDPVPIEYRFDFDLENKHHKFAFHSFQFSAPAYEHAVKAAGFSSINWFPLEIPDSWDNEKRKNHAILTDLKQSPIALFELVV